MLPSFRILAVVSCVAFFSAVVVAHQLEPYNVCDVKCVQQIYKDYCGGVSCVFGATYEEEKTALCSDTCTDALMGDTMFKCLAEKDHGRGDFELVVDTFLQQIIRFCEDVPEMEAPPCQAAPCQVSHGVKDVDDLPDMD